MDDLPEEAKKIIIRAGNQSPIARGIAICEAQVRNTIAVNELKSTIAKQDENNGKLNRKIYSLTLFNVGLTFIQALAIFPDFGKYGAIGKFALETFGKSGLLVVGLVGLVLTIIGAFLCRCSPSWTI